MCSAPERVERPRKPVKCPQCRHRPVAEILYGMPAMDADLEKEMKEGRITIGGCCIGSDDPAWECTGCGLKIFRADGRDVGLSD